MASALRSGLLVSGLSRLCGDDLGRLVEIARIAEDAGVHQVALPDHLAIGPRTDRYPYGRYPLPAEEPYPEPLVALAAMAGATRRVRLGTGILIAPLRRALVLAKSAATLDAVSGGRLDLGVGVGWQPEEFDAAGVPFAARWRRLDETLRACRALWTESPASFHGESVSFEKLWCEPRPRQAGGPPLWFGVAASARNARRIAELGTGWMPMPLAAEDLAAGVERLGDAFRAAGRDPAELRVRVSVRPELTAEGRPDLDATVRALEPLAAAGATDASFPLGFFASRLEKVAPFAEALTRALGGPAS